MAMMKPAIALDPALFGRKGAVAADPLEQPSLASDLRLFATAFIAGFAFVSMLIA